MSVNKLTRIYIATLLLLVIQIKLSSTSHYIVFQKKHNFFFNLIQFLLTINVG